VPFFLNRNVRTQCSNTVINFDSLRQEGNAHGTLPALRVAVIRGRFSGKQLANK